MVMAVTVTIGEYEDLKAEHKACQQQLRSKDEALKIFQQQLRNSDVNHLKLQQEIKQLRSQLARSHPVSPTGESTSTLASSVASEEIREKYIVQLEEFQEKLLGLERQVQHLEDEKEELMCERDYFSGKCDSLLKCLNDKQSTPQPSHSTLQSLIEENHRLKMDLVEVQAERDHALSRVDRYKNVIERQKAIELAVNQGMQSPLGDKKQELRQTMKRVKELESLANSLSGSVKEKSLALTHQKKANKMLAKRIAELEHRLKVLEISGLWSHSDSLLPEMQQPPLSPERIDTEGVDDGSGEVKVEQTDKEVENDSEEALGGLQKLSLPEKPVLLNTSTLVVKESPGHSEIVNLA